MVSNPTAVPNIGDLFRPATDPGVSTVTISPTVQPADASAPNPGSRHPALGTVRGHILLELLNLGERVWDHLHIADDPIKVLLPARRCSQKC